VTRRLPQSWFDTPNIHLCTVLDFLALAEEMGLTIEQQHFLCNRRRVRAWPNLRADHALFVLRK